MIKGIISLFSPRYPNNLIYMLQSTEYKPGAYLRWYWRTSDFNSVAHRRRLERTTRAKTLLTALRSGMAVQILVSILFLWYGLTHHWAGVWSFSLALLVSYPLVWAHMIIIPLILGRWFIAEPKERLLIAQSAEIFAKHRGTKIAIAGSYGKTSMKELLGTVLAESKTVAKTPANKNVAVSHAIFARRLSGKEDVLIIEYGEAKPGDVKRFVEMTHPDVGIITGLAPAHLDRYKTIKAAGKDIFNLAIYLEDKNVYVNDESIALQPFIKPRYYLYSAKGALGWTVHSVKVDVNSLRFTLKKGVRTLKLKSGLIGRHQIGPVAFAAALADHMGLTKKQIESGVQKTKSFEHRMQPRLLAGAWLIDDTYNGNLEGVKAGLALLKELKARRKIYVTPGLVDQGQETERVHKKMGEHIALAHPDKVVLMKNSTTAWIKDGLKKNNFYGELVIEDEPLKFYNNIDQFVAAGDIVLMQNDWTDNYA